ncbi:hypothetical protein [Phenylobacterium sp.]|uniref:hypothetical protein n=1 Tax=Phenylobacterium sp. TaxID=1871053 RepID=UPI0035B1C2BD
MDDRKTHVLRAKPQMSIRTLADYMAASDRARRTVVRGCKFRPIARVVQHDEAKLAIASYLLSGASDPWALSARADYIRNKHSEDQFEADLNQHNADYLDRFSSVAENTHFPKGAELRGATSYAALNLNGVRVTFRPDLMVRRLTKMNVARVGALMLRYQKGQKLPLKVAEYQSAAIHGVLAMHGVEPGEEVDKALCLILDAYTGTIFSAPGNAVTLFNNMKAACATISEGWQNIEPPPGAVV